MSSFILRHKLFQQSEYAGFDHYADTFQRIQSHPLTWNKKQHIFIETKDHKKLSKWYFSMALSAFTICCCFYVCLKELFLKGITIPYWLSGLQFVFATFGTVIFSCNVLGFMFTTEIISTWYDFKKLGDKVKRG